MADIRKEQEREELKVYSHFIPDTASRAMDAFSKLA